MSETDSNQDTDQSIPTQDSYQQNNTLPLSVEAPTIAVEVYEDTAPIQLSSTVPSVEDEHLNNDDRQKGEWASRWDTEAIIHIKFEAIYVGIVFILTFLALIFTWRGTIFELVSTDCSSCVRPRFDQFAYFFLGGMLGGTLFGIKYLYKVVARGWWHQDRRLWRIFSPFISGGLAFAIGTLIDSGIFGLAVKNPTTSSYLSLGFISGYFADNALAKMQEIAETIFGSGKRHGPQPKTQQQSTKK